MHPVGHFRVFKGNFDILGERDQLASDWMAERIRPGGTFRAMAMGVDLKSNAIGTSHALRTSERATQFNLLVGCWSFPSRPTLLRRDTAIRDLATIHEPASPYRDGLLAMLPQFALAQ